MGGSVAGGGLYPLDSTAEIHAFPNDGYNFSNWTGTSIHDSKTTQTTVLMDQNHSITANFVRSHARLEVNAEIGGTVNGDGLYELNSSVPVIAIPESGYAFLNWKGSRGCKLSAASTFINLQDDSNMHVWVFMYLSFSQKSNLKWFEEWDGIICRRVS